jgi:hypothetical protein
MSANPISMAEVIDRLFNRLAASYGAEWTRQWAGMPISDVKTTWGHELSLFLGDLKAISYALDNLPERCPNVIQFKALCRAGRTVKTTLMLPEPKSNPAFIAQVVAQLAAPGPKIDGLDWARRIMARQADGEYINPFTLQQAKAALRMTGELQAAAGVAA